jgi:hypothetical protein
VAAYLESSMGPENMGYQVRRDTFQQGGIDLSNVDVELTNKKRFREILLVLVPYGDTDPARQSAEVQALATLLSVAHAITGESGSQTLRLAAIPAAHDPASLERFVSAARGKEERFMQVFVLGDPSPATPNHAAKDLPSRRNRHRDSKSPCHPGLSDHLARRSGAENPVAGAAEVMRAFGGREAGIGSEIRNTSRRDQPVSCSPVHRC